MNASGEARRVYEAALRSDWDSYLHYRVLCPNSPRRKVINSGAIAAAYAGDVSRLVDCLRARKPLTPDDRRALSVYIATKAPWRWPKGLADALRNQTDSDFDVLADFVADKGRRRGRQRNEPVHDAARLAEVLMSLEAGRTTAAVRGAFIKYACEIVSKETGAHITEEQVRDLLDHKKNRRHKY
jgi:hypothetical protein